MPYQHIFLQRNIFHGIVCIALLAYPLGCSKQSKQSSANDDDDSASNPAAQTDKDSSNAHRQVTGSNSGKQSDQKHERAYWSRFRNFNGNATSHSRRAPLSWDDNTNIAWKSPLSGRGSSSPIIWDDKIFLTSYTGYGLEKIQEGDKADLLHHVICIDRASGKQLWQRSIQSSPAIQEMNKELLGHGYASSTPATDGKHVYAFFGASGVYAFDMDGKFVWKSNVGCATHHFGSSASPIIFKDYLIVNASVESKAIYAFNKNTGGLIWKIDGIIESWTTPSVVYTPGKKPEMVVNFKNRIHSYDPRSGKLIWECDGIKDYIIPSPVHHEGIVYCSGGRQRRTIAIRIGGEGDVTETHKLWESPLAANVCSPIYHDGHLYVANTGRVLECINATTGKVVKHMRLKARQHVHASPTLIGDHIYFPTQDAGTVVIQASPDLKVVNTNKFANDSSSVQASLAVADAEIFLRNDKFLYCISKHKQADSNATPVVTDQTVIQAPVHFDFGKNGRIKHYVQYMTDDVEHIIFIILRPYKSVITPEQTQSSRKYVLDRIDQYKDLNQRYQDAYWEYQKDGSDRDTEKLIRTLADIEKDMLKLTGDTRIDVKKQFSKEQLDKHIAEAEEFKRQEAERLKKLSEKLEESK